MFNVRCSPLFAAMLLLTNIAATTSPTTQSTTRPTTRATTQSVAPPTAPNLQLHECTVFVIDASTGLLNPDGIVTATLPVFVTDHRFGSASAPAPAQQPVNNNGWVVWNGRMVRAGAVPSADGKKPTDAANATASDPQPVGVIRLTGTYDAKVDVSLSAKGGTFAGSSPKAEDRANQILWRDLTVSDQPAVPASPLSEDHWYSKLRSVQADYLSLGKLPSERFLLYDLQMPFPSPLKIKAGKDDSLEVTNSGKYPLHEVMFYRDGSEGSPIELQGAEPDQPLKAATKPSSRPTTAATRPVAATGPVTAPSTSGSVTKSTANVQLAHRVTSQPYVWWWPWEDRMKAAAVNDADRIAIAALLERYARDRRLTAVYAMDPDELDHLVPIEVVPQPAIISRFALVIVVNADPSAGNIVDDLIKQLGDDDWTKRDAAYHALARMGPAATSRLQAASKGADLETAWRAERLLALNPAAKP